jgi:hypothetical protein
MEKKTNRSAFNSFLKKNAGNLYWKETRRYNELTEASYKVKDEFSKVDEFPSDCLLSGVRFFTHEDKEFIGISYHNFYDSGIIAIKKTAVKFFWNGIKIGGILHTCWYSAGPYNEASKLPEGTITLHAKTYADFPRLEGVVIENDSDLVSDYCEKDTMRIYPGNKYYSDARTAYEKAEAREAARLEKKYGKTA